MHALVPLRVHAPLSFSKKLHNFGQKSNFYLEGYSLYELGSVNNWERSLLSNERPVEVMARWEKQRSTNQQLQFKFVMKKHLFTELELSDTVEKELIYHQLLHQARNDRFVQHF